MRAPLTPLLLCALQAAQNSPLAFLDSSNQLSPLAFLHSGGGQTESVSALPGFPTLCHVCDMQLHVMQHFAAWCKMGAITNPFDRVMRV